MPIINFAMIRIITQSTDKPVFVAAATLAFSGSCATTTVNVPQSP